MKNIDTCLLICAQTSVKRVCTTFGMRVCGCHGKRQQSRDPMVSLLADTRLSIYLYIYVWRRNSLLLWSAIALGVSQTRVDVLPVHFPKRWVTLEIWHTVKPYEHRYLFQFICHFCVTFFRCSVPRLKRKSNISIHTLRISYWENSNLLLEYVINLSSISETSVFHSFI